MSVQYLSNKKGQVTAVQLPIDEWEFIKSKYLNVENLKQDLPQWQKDLIDARLADIARHSELIRPIAELMAELDK